MNDADIERRALRLFTANHTDADPNLVAHMWDNDPHVRQFWINQVRNVLGDIP